MVEIRSYTNVWKIERMLYGVNDYHLPRPIPYSTVIWFAVGFLLSFQLAGIPPFIFGSPLVDHIGIPGLLAWLMGKLKVDGKNPIGVILSVCRYLIRPRVMVRGKAVRMEDVEYRDLLITVGRRRELGRDQEISDKIS